MLAGHEAEEAVSELSRLLTVKPLGESCLSAEALEAGVNATIRQLAPSSRNPGLQRKRLAHSAPLRLRTELRVPTDDKASVEATYLSEDLLLVLTDTMNDGSKYELKLASVADTIKIVGSTEMVSPRTRTRDALGRLVTASSNGIRVYETNRSTLEVQEIGVYRSSGLHGMTIASSRDLPFVAVGSWTDPPVLLNTVKGQCRPLQIGTNVKSVGNGHVAFLGGRKLVFHQDSGLVVYEVDFDGHDDIVQRWPYPREVTALEASQELGLIFVGWLGGLECLDVKNGERKWAVDLETSGIWQAHLDSASRVLAVTCGLLEKSRIALIEVEGGTMVFLPDGGDNDTLRTARYFDWSPSCATFCVSDREGVLSVFCL